MSSPVSTWNLAVPPFDTRTVGSWTLAFDSLESTQGTALEYQHDGLVVIADRQLAGRGSHGRSWHSPPGLGLYFSVLLSGSPQGMAWAGALAVRDAVSPVAAPTLKWPNDLLLDGRKIAGVLVEHRTGWNAVGIGINVHHQPDDFPPDLRASAGSLEQITGREWDRKQLLSDVLTELERYVCVLRGGGLDDLRTQWLNACGVAGRRVRQGALEGVVRAIDDDGALVVDADGVTRRLMRGPIDYVSEE